MPDRDVSSDNSAAHTDPEDPRKPDSPQQLKSMSWKFSITRSAKKFMRDQCTDLAATLTYYAVLSIFPALIALVSLLGVFGQGRTTTDALLNMVDNVAPPAATELFAGPIQNLVESPAAGFALIAGLLGALWTGSAYVNAFGRAMNRIYGVSEGRPIWKLRPTMILVTVVILLLIAAVAMMLELTGPVARTIGDAVGLGETAVAVWNIARWPILAAIVVLVVALLYYATPNVRQPRFRWISPGALIGVVAWLLASLGLTFYVANFGSYNETYGSLGGVIVFLLWLWVTNLALLFGAEFDAETERAREVQAGLPAETELQPPPRDTRKIEKDAEREARDIPRASALRRTNGASAEPEDPPPRPESVG